MEDNNIEIMEEDQDQGFWAKKIALPVVFIAGGVSLIVGGAIGFFAGKTWAKKGAEERESNNVANAEENNSKA